MKDKIEKQEEQVDVTESADNQENPWLARVAELEAQLEEEKNAKLMTMADFQNYKKRLENEKNDYRIFATKMIMGQLMQIVDDFERAKKDVEEKLKDNEHNAEVQNSLKMISDKMDLLIGQNGFEEIKINVGDAMDPDTMEVITAIPLSEEEKDKNGKVIHIDQKGFRHVESGIVFKTAKVIIGKFNK